MDTLGLSALPIAVGNGVGVVAVVLIIGGLLWSGRLYTKGQVDRMDAAHIAEIGRMVKAHEREVADKEHDRGEWRTESRIKDQTIVELSDQNRAMLAGFDTLAEFLRGMRTAAKQREGEDQ